MNRKLRSNIINIIRLKLPLRIIPNYLSGIIGKGEVIRGVISKL